MFDSRDLEDATVKCKKCKQDKPAAQMSKWGGKPSKVCLKCREGEKPAAEAEAPKVNGSDGAHPMLLSVAASIGFMAQVSDDGMLVISQANSSRPDDPDNVTLTRAEAKRLFDAFGVWIVGEAA